MILTWCLLVMLGLIGLYLIVIAAAGDMRVTRILDHRNRCGERQLQVSQLVERAEQELVLPPVVADEKPKSKPTEREKLAAISDLPNDPTTEHQLQLLEQLDEALAKDPSLGGVSVQQMIDHDRPRSSLLSVHDL